MELLVAMLLVCGLGLVGLLIVPHEGDEVLAARMVNKSAPDDCVLRLFTNDLTPTADNVLADFTECTDGSYAAITLTGASWSVATAGSVTAALYAIQTFNFAGSVNVYGYYVTDNAGTKVLFCERLNNAPFAADATHPFQVVPKFALHGD